MSTPSAAGAYEQAEDHFKDDEFDAAAPLYDQAVELAPGNARYLANRASNSLKLKRYSSTLEDATAALAIEPTNGRVHMRKAMALFHLDRFADAQATFEAAAQHGQEKTDLWLRKVKAELDRTAAAPSVVATVQATLAVGHKIDAMSPAKPTEKATAVLLNLAERTREQWYQSPTDVTITILAKGLKQEQVQIEFDESTNILKAALNFPSDASKWAREWQLWGRVGGQPTIAMTAYKIELALVKAGESTWDALERKAGVEVAPIVKRENVMRPGVNYAAYPTSSKTMKNWAEVEQSAKQAEAEEKPEGDAALQKLFQSIYGGADEDSRRAMVKSFQTSGGTVLSTNWKEVAEKDYAKEQDAHSGRR